MAVISKQRVRAGPLATAAEASNLSNSDRITLRRSQRKALLIRLCQTSFRPTYFFHNLRSRLSWQ